MTFLTSIWSIFCEQGVFFTNVDSSVYDSRENIRKALQEVANLGIKIVYPCIWNKNQAFWKSPTVQRTLGDEAVNAYGNRDILQEFIDESAELGLKVYPWFEYGLKVVVKRGDNASSSQLTESGRIFLEKRWLTTNFQGLYSMPFKWGVQKGFLNPEHSEVKKFLRSIMIELCSYSVEGVLIDDHFSMHPSFAFDRHSQETSDSKIERNTIANFRIKTSSISNLLIELGQLIRKSGKKFILSPAGDLNFSKNIWMQDWFAVVKSGVVDQLLLQAYRYNLQGFKTLLNNYHFKLSRQYADLGVVILAGLLNNSKMDAALISQQATFARQNDLKTSYFYYDSLLSPAKGKESSTQRQQGISAILGKSVEQKIATETAENNLLNHQKSVNYDDLF